MIYRKKGFIIINEKVTALLNEVFKGKCIDSIKIANDNTIEVNGQTYLVLDDEEADNYYYNYQMEFIDDVGLEGFSNYFKNWIIDNCIDEEYFFNIMNECNEFYLDDIESENSLTHDNRLEEEIEESGCTDRDEYLEFLNNNYDSAVDWYRDNFGDDMLTEYIKEHENLIDWDKVIEECKSIDGRGIISSYDGCEIELDDWYFAYRID